MSWAFQPLLPATPLLSRPVSDLTDNFDDNSLDTSKWQHAQSAGSGKLAEANQRIELTVSSDEISAGLVSKYGHDFTDGSIQIELVNPSSWNSDLNLVFGLVVNNSTLEYGSWSGAFFVKDDAGDLSWNITLGSSSESGSATFSATNHKYLRIRHSGTRIYFETSANGYVWNAFGDGLYTGIYAGLYTTWYKHAYPAFFGYQYSGSNNTVYLDNFNIEAQKPFILTPSSNFADGDATTYQLSSSTGFVAGKMSEGSNPLSSIDLSAGGHTEVEWNIEATSVAETSAIYEFRVTDSGTVLTEHQATPEWTIAAGATTVTITHTTDTLKRKAGTSTHTTDTLKRVVGVLAHTTNTLKRKTSTLTHTTDTFKKKPVTVTHATNTLKRKATTPTHTTDTLKRSATTGIHTTDTYKQKSSTLTHSVDALKKRANTITHTTNTLKRTANTLTHTTDSMKKTLGNLSYTTDTIKRDTNTLTHTTDTFLKKPITLWHTTDTLKRTVQVLSHTTDVFKRISPLLTHLVDTLKRKAGNLTHTTNVLKRDITTLTHTTDAYKRRQITLPHTTDAYKRVTPIVYLSNASDTTTQTTFTFSSVGLGAAASDRYIIVSVAARKAGTGGTISSVTVGGETATIITQITNSGDSNSHVAGLAIAHVTSGTTGDIVVTMNTDHLRMAIGVWRAVSLSSPTPHDYGSSTATNPTYDIDVLAGGFVVGMASTSNTSTFSWTGIDEDFDTSPHTFLAHSGAHTIFDTEQTNLTVTATPSTSANPAGVFASWEVGSPYVTETLTHTSDILKRKAGTIAHTADTLKRKDNTITHSTNTLSHVLITLTHTTGTLKRKAGTVIHSTDSLKRKAYAVTHSTNTLKRTTISIAHTTNTLKRKAGSIVHTADVFKRTGNTQVHTTDTNKRRAYAVSHTTDTIARIRTVITHTVDVLKRKSGTVTYTTDTYKRKGGTVNHSTNTIKRRVYTLNHSTNTLKRSANTSTHTTNTLKRRAGSITHTTDVSIHRSYTVDHTTNIYTRTPIRITGRIFATIRPSTVYALITPSAVRAVITHAGLYATIIPSRLLARITHRRIQAEIDPQ